MHLAAVGPALPYDFSMTAALHARQRGSSGFASPSRNGHDFDGRRGAAQPTGLARLQSAGGQAEAFAPLLDDFRDQVLYLGYDLSPEAIADLSEETAEFNALATDTVAKVKTMLEGTGDGESPLGDPAADDDEG